MRGLLLLTLILAASAASAGEPLSPFDASDVLVAIIREVPAGKWTNGRPPRVVVSLEEVWHTCDWPPYAIMAPGYYVPHTPDDVEQARRTVRVSVEWGPAPNQPDAQGRRVDEATWRGAELKPPEVGSKWIVLGLSVGGVIYSDARQRFEWSDVNAQYVRQKLDKRMGSNISSYPPSLHAAATAIWRASFSDEDIQRFVDEADVVVTGWMGATSGYHWHVDEAIKGGRYVRDNQVYTVLSKETAGLCAASTPCLIFIKLDKRSFTNSSKHFGDGNTAGLMIADERALTIARAAAKARPAPVMPRVLLCTAQPFSRWGAPEIVGMHMVVETRYYAGGWEPEVIAKDLNAAASFEYVVRVREGRDGKRETITFKAVSATTGKVLVEQQWPKGTPEEYQAQLSDAIRGLTQKQ